tara:strand:+ start:112 stop:435 length:324 start_codon:yes stop_codon:yes gene_type:complete
MNITDRARQAIADGTAYKENALAEIGADHPDAPHYAAIDPARGLVTVRRAEAESLLDSAPEGDAVAADLRKGLDNSDGAAVVYWQAGDVLHVAGNNPPAPAAGPDEE